MRFSANVKKYKYDRKRNKLSVLIISVLTIFAPRFLRQRKIMAKCIEGLNPSGDVVYLIWRISRYWQREKHKSLDEFGLTGSQLEIMGALYHMSINEKQVTQIQLSQVTEIDPMTTSTILRNLQKKGLIVRSQSKTDTRARIVELTEDGKSLFLKAIVKIKEIHNRTFKNVDIPVLQRELRKLWNEIEEFQDIK